MGRAFNPVIEYLDALRWDGVPRVDEFLVRYAGVADSPYVRKVGAVFLLSAAARQLTPGCKVDTVVVLEGYQGTKKSSLLCTLASKEFFTNELGSIGAKDADEKLQGTWLIEVPELEKFRKSSVETLKAFISRSTDRFRWTYATEVRDYPRTCIFVCKTNETSYLHDHTGNLRFLPITVGDIDLEAVERDRDQLWAEAVFRKRRGEDHFIRDDDPVLSLARAEQEDRVVRDAWHDIIEEYVLAHDSVGVTLTEVLSEAVRLPPALQTPSHVARVQRILVSVGWERKRVTQGTRRVWMYLPKTRKAS
jgi:predicted P-loop ATPase